MKINEQIIHKILKETLHNLINEERGVAFTSFEEQITTVINYIREYVKNNKPTDKIRQSLSVSDFDTYDATDYVYEFAIPESIMGQFNFIDGLVLNAYIHTINIPERLVGMIDPNEFEGEGYYQSKAGPNDEYENGVNKFNRLTQDGKLEGGEIYLDGVIINGKDNFSRIEEVLSHELTHAYKNFMTLKNGINTDTENSVNRYEDVQNLKHSSKRESYFVSRRASYMIYRLWDREEMDAEASTVYVYILRNNLNRRNFKQDIRKTHAFQEYVNFQKTIDFLERIPEPEEFVEVAKALNIKFDNPKSFKDYFIKKSKQLNQLYLQRIGNVASLAYDKIENI